jgi:hypothetical protein
LSVSASAFGNDILDADTDPEVCRISLLFSEQDLPEYGVPGGGRGGMQNPPRRSSGIWRFIVLLASDRVEFHNSGI